MAGSSSPSIPQDKHEVFLSFRGEDTRHTFTSHLHAALFRLQIKAYIDYNLERGDEISTTLLRAIEESKLSVVVLSENYATSKWCLDELVKILECKKKNGQIIVPVFYNIDPSNVRNQTGTYAVAFAKHEKQFQGNTNRVQRWRSALAEVANVAGWDCSVNRMESELVEKIARDVLQKLNYVYVGDLDEQISKYEQLANLQAQISCAEVGSMLNFGVIFNQPTSILGSLEWTKTFVYLDCHMVCSFHCEGIFRYDEMLNQ